MKIQPIAICLALCVSTGCYAYLPLQTTPKIGERVRVSLTQQGTTELARYLGPRVVGAEGALSALNPDGAYVVAVDFVQHTDNVRQPWSGEGVVTIPLQFATGVRQRTFQKRRTVVTTALVGAGILAAAIIALRQEGSPGSGTIPPPPPP